MDVLVLIDKLDDIIHNARSVPLTDSVMIDREEMYDILDQMRSTIPEEIKQARWIVKERQEMLAEAKQEAERMLTEAQERADRLASETEVVRLAERNAQQTMEDARERERETRLGAEDYADEVLGNLEVDLEVAEHLVGVVLGAQAGLALALAGILHGLLGVALGEAHHLGLRGEPVGALLSLREHALGLLLGLGEHLLALLDDPARLLDLLGNGGAHLVEDVVHLLAVDHDAVGERHGPGVVDDVVELVDENEHVHTQQPSLGSLATRRIDLRQAAGDARGHQVFHGASERGDLPDPARA